MHAVDYNQECTSTLIDSLATYLIDLDGEGAIKQVHDELENKIKLLFSTCPFVVGNLNDIYLFCPFIHRYSKTPLKRLRGESNVMDWPTRVCTTCSALNFLQKRCHSCALRAVYSISVR